MERACVDEDIVTDLRRIFVYGCPGYVNATGSDKNFHDYLAYGNHATVLEDPEKTKKAVAKDVVRQYSLAANPSLLYFLYNCHLNPIGLIDLNKRNKKPRIIYDSSFRPHHDSWAVNDWTNKATEPQIYFATSFMLYLIWIYNMRISYPWLEIFLLDDDVSGAFRHAKFNPNIIGMHCFLLFGCLFFATGQSFGGNTCPSNFEPIARARQQLAQHLFNQEDTVARVQEFLPQLNTADPPTPAEIQNFTRAEADELNTGVLNEDGSQKPPQYNHHVDDNMYAAILQHLLRTIAASILSLYIILGFPSNFFRDVVSWDKFATLLSHQRVSVGWLVDSRRLSVTLPDHKRDQLIELVQEWIDQDRFTMRELAVLLGHLENATLVCRWMRASYFNIQHTLRRILQTRYNQVSHYRSRNERQQRLEPSLPNAVKYRLESLVSREIATALWGGKEQFRKTAVMQRELQAILHSLKTERWEIFIPQIIPRTPHLNSVGDASQTAGGAICETLKYWFRVIWGEKTLRAIKLHHKHKDNVHINCLELIIVILQLAATIVRLESAVPVNLQDIFPQGYPDFPVLLSLTDNTPTKRWMNKAGTTSTRACHLISVLGQLLKRTTTATNTDWLEGKTNFVPDWISRPDLTLTPVELQSQTYQKFPYLKHWDIFLPSPELCQVLESCLFTEHWKAPPRMPSDLGRFVPGDYITSSFVNI